MKSTNAITTSKVNLRLWPAIPKDSEQPNVITSLPSGENATIFDDLSYTDADHTWKYIVSPEGKWHGWVAAEYLSADGITVPPASKPIGAVPMTASPSSPSTTAASVVPLPQVSRIKFGWHITYDTTIDRIVIPHAEKMKGIIAGYTVVSQPELANKLADYATVMYRQYFDPQTTYKTSWLDGLTEQQAYDVGYKFYYDKHYDSTKKAYKAHYIKMVNECGWCPMDSAFWLGAMAAAEKDGRRLAIFGDSSGTPEVEQWVTRIPALRHAMANNHVVTLNQYGRTGPHGEDADYRVSDDLGYEYFGGRHIRLYDAVPEDCRPLLVIGETGASASTKTQPFAVEDAVKYSQKLAAGKYGERILFISLFTLGQWFQNRLDSQIPIAENLLKAL